MIAGIGVGGVIYSFLVSYLMRFTTRTGLMAWGGIFGAIGIAATITLPNWGILFALITVLGFGFGMLHNTLQTEVASLAPQARAAAFSAHAFSFFMGQAIGPVLFGWGLHHMGLSWTMMLQALLLAAVGFGAAHLFRRLGRDLV